MDKTESNSEKALKNLRKNRGSVPGPITNVDVARLLGMPEDMINELFGDEAGNSEDNMTGKRKEESGGHLKDVDDIG